VQFRELGVPYAWEVTPRPHADDRGVFLEIYQDRPFAEAVGHPLEVRQVNTSVSRRGTVRGIHFADVPPGQGKYVSCARGAVLDVIVDLRVGSPRYGAWEGVVLDDVERRAVYLAEGLGHVFVALSDDATVTYLCSQPYAPTREHAVHPLDPAIGIELPSFVEPLISPKDAAAPTLDQARDQGVLPTWEECLRWYEQLRAG
jgi:dTDP-4-dehydrorhamnose 3,5-epimerase